MCVDSECDGTVCKGGLVLFVCVNVSRRHDDFTGVEIKGWCGWGGVRWC